MCLGLSKACSAATTDQSIDDVLSGLEVTYCVLVSGLKVAVVVFYPVAYFSNRIKCLNSQMFLSFCNKIELYKMTP